MGGRFRSAFTLIEVNLAIFIMAGGVLAMVSLYSLGFKESRQSREDVASAAMADRILNPLVVALSSTNLAWSAWTGLNFNSIKGDDDEVVDVMPNDGWFAYVKHESYSSGKKRKSRYWVDRSPESVASPVYNRLMGGADKSALPGRVSGSPTLPSGMTYALVASRENKHSPVITLGVRCVRKNLRNTLMSQPVFSTEVHFQGDPNR